MTKETDLNESEGILVSAWKHVYSHLQRVVSREYEPSEKMLVQWILNSFSRIYNLFKTFIYHIWIIKG